MSILSCPRLASVVALLVVALYGSPLAAQHGNPSVHFGASTVPEPSDGLTLGIYLDRFTPFATTEAGERLRYNEVARTLGFNTVQASLARRVGEGGRLQLRVSGQVGVGHNQPTAWIQARLHALVGYDQVEVVDPRNSALDGAVSIEAVRWGVLHDDGFAGAGLSAGTPYSELWIFSGFSRRIGPAGPGLSAVLRLGFTRGGAVFRSQALARSYGAAEVRADLPLAEWLERDWLPSMFVAVSQDTGFFRDAHEGSRPERNGTFGFVSPSGRWTIEFWNEYFGGRWQDVGPTGGGRLTYRFGG